MDEILKLFGGFGLIAFISFLVWLAGKQSKKGIKDLDPKKKETPQNKSFEDGPE